MHDVSTAMEHDLRRLVRGQVLFDDISRTIYATAACLFEMVPMGCVVPQDAEDVMHLVQYCGRHGIPLTGRGAGSSLAGQALGSGLIVDFSRRMNRILEIDVDRGWVRVQPGVVLRQLNETLKPHGFFFPPDPASGAMCTVGGMIQTNAGGVHSVKYGTTRDYLVELSCILDNGEPARVRNERARAKLAGRHGEIFSRTAALIRNHLAVIREGRPQSPKNSSGYHLYDVVNAGTVRLQRLVSGSEGTLCLVPEAKLAIRKKPRHRVLALMVFPDSNAACEPVSSILALEPSALEIMDETVVRFVADFDPSHAGLLGAPDRSVVLCEFDGDDARELAAKARRLRKFCRGVRIVQEKNYHHLWQLRQSVSPALERRPGRRRSTRVIEDAGVEPARVPEYIRGVKKILRTHRLEAAIFGHLGSGNIHVNVFLDLSEPKDVEKMQALSFEVAELVRGLRGTLSGEHGDGLLRGQELRRQFPELYPVFEKVKEIWDPRGLFNPGKKLTPKSYRFVQDLRSSRRPGFHTTGPFARAEKHLQICNGCAKCHAYCPLFLDNPVEFSAPRAKVNLMLGAGEGRLEPSLLTGDPVFKAHMQTCLTCRKCLTDCPAGVDLPRISNSYLRAAKEDR